MYKIQTNHRTNLRVCDSIISNEGITIPVIAGICSETDVVSPNGYRYKSSFWHKVLSQSYVKDMISNRTSLGTIEHPEDDNAYMKTPYEMASHVVLSVELKGNNPYAKFGILNNTKGNSIKALVDLNVPVGVSTRGLGDTLQDEISPYIDEDNYAFITWDVVNNPNFGDLSLVKVTDSLRNTSLFKELVEAYSLRDSVDEHYSTSFLLSEIDKMQSCLTSMKSFLELHQSKDLLSCDFTAPVLTLTNTVVPQGLLQDSYSNVELVDCKVSYPSKFTVKDSFVVRGNTNLPSNCNCHVLDIRGCKSISHIPDSLKFDILLAQGSGLNELPSMLKADSINIVSTSITEIPKSVFVKELLADSSVKISGTVLNLIRV